MKKRGKKKLNGVSSPLQVKQSLSFRFLPETVEDLLYLAKRLRMSKTGTINWVIREAAKVERSQQEERP